MPYYGDGVPYYYGGPFANHSSLMTGISRYHNPIAARYSPHLSTITESPLITLRRFSPAATTTSTSVSIARSRRIIDTADIDVTKKPRSLTQDNRQSRHRLRRDRPTIKIRSQALKDNPALREYNEKHEKSVGELLVEKFLIKDKQYEEDRPKIKLYHQASLMSSDNNNEDTFDERENELLAAIRRRVTRRMTRRRSSVDIIPLDPEQIQREAAYHAAQAEALDNLVAEEQAEIEVEMRRGTFAKRQAMKLPLEISEISETEDDDELDIEERINSASKKHVTTKKKKKRKIIDKPKSEEENDRKDSIIADSIIEEEEFEWDDREKCNDVAKIVPKLEKMNKQKDITIENNQIKENVKQNDILKRREKGVIGFNKHITTDHTSKEEINQTSELKSKNRKIQDKERLDKVKPKEKEKEEKLSVEKKLENVSKNCTHIIAEQKEVDTKDSATHFKIEACNSVGDFSTLYINAANTPTSEKPVRTIEQFRESIRLPAPRRPGSNNIETEVILPVHKPYIHDTSRNSVYLALKPSQTARPNKMQDIDDQQIEQIINDEIRKESLIDSSRSAKWGEVGGDRSAQESNSIDERKNNASKIINATVLQSQQTEKSLKSESDQTLNKFEKLVNKSSKPSLLGVKEEFIENFKKEKNNIVENKIDNKLNLTNNIEPEEIIKNETQNLTKAKCNLNNKPETGLEFEKKIKESLDEVKKKINTVKVESKKLTNKIDNFKLESKSLIEPEFKIEDNIKNKVEITSKNKVGDLSEKTKSQVKVIKDTVKDVISESKLKNTNQITDAKKIVNKSAFSEEIPSVEGSNQLKTTEKFQCPLKVLHQNSPQTKPDQLSISTTEQNVFNTDLTTPKRDLPRKNDRHLPKILEEPKSPPTTVTQQIKLPQLKKNDTKANKSSLIKESDNKVNKLVTEPNLTIVPKNDKKKKIDTEGTMKIEKKILEDEESPHKISTTVLPETACITETSTALLKNDEKQKEPLMSSAKVGLQPKTKKKSSELPVAVEATEATAAVTEIDFWSEIGAQEGGAKVSGMPKKVQSAVDLTRINEQKQQAIKSSEPLTLDLSNVKAWTEDQDKLKTPLILDQEELKTPLILEPKSPLVENLKQVPLINLQLTDDNRATIIYNDTYELDNKNKISKEKEKNKESVEETQAELSGTVKKISKWTNRDNLSNLNETDEQVTSVAYKEAAPQVSTPPSTSTKKKIVKKKKSTPSGTKKKSDKVESAKSKTNNKSKVATKKPAASPQTSQLKTAMSASGSPRNTPSQRPPDLMKLFYTTPAILLTATPRDLRKVRRAKVKRKKPQTRTPSLSSDSTGSTRSTATTSTEEGSNCEEDNEQKRQTSTRSNDSGFDGSPRLSTPSQSSENQRNAEGDHFHHSGRITPPATNLPRFKKYEVTDFNFLKVLGKGSFGKVLLAELRGTECVYAVKCLKKDVVLEDDDVECTLIERKVLTLATRHPYLCHLFCTFQTESHLFFVMEYLNGGDLMFHIQKSGRFAEQRAKFYAAEIWSGLIFLHKKGIVYRDLKLDNVLLDFEGHIRIADFGMCKLQIFLDRTADTFCGTPDYMAPEIIKGLKYNQAVDWWSFGVLLYEMLTGQSPFSGCDEDELFWSICNERPFIPRYLGQSATDLLVSLLEKDSGKRIPGHEIACHPFFCTVSWDKLERRSLEPPFKPAVEHTLDTRYFDTAFTAERPRLTAVPEQILTSMDQGVFRGFSYTNPNATD